MSIKELQQQTTVNVQEKANLIWAIADKLVGVYKPHEYGNVILPMCVVKRFEDTLAPTRQKVLDSKFFYYYMLADSKRIRENAFFTTLPIINNGYLSGISILCPPLFEQHAIASYLDEKCADIDRLIAIKQQKIETLKDYKKSVIYEAVTGKTIV